MSRIVSFIFVLSSLLCVAAPILAAEDRDRTGLEFFEKNIRPVLVKRCYECHSAKSKRLRGKLRLDTRAGLRRGGESGPGLVPGKPEKSRLISALKQQDLEMPPSGRLSKSVIANFVHWIKIGAPDPRTGSAVLPHASGTSGLVEARRFWSLRPLKKPRLPVIHSRWKLAPLDRFIQAKLTAHSLRGAPRTDKRTLLRRLSFDLLGLPPTPAEIEKFLADGSEQATARLVDRMLGSRHFGERWGRHWLDVARFAESSGGGRTAVYHLAWRYRDYVMNALNSDKPYNDFVREQIAGDLLPWKTIAERREQLTATAFLMLGPTNYELQDKELLRMEVIDEQLDTVGRAFLGLTIGCARCHDHKFDPISHRDYYALAGIFRSTHILTPGNVSGYLKRPLPLSQQHARQLATYEKRVNPLKDEIAGLNEQLKRLRRNQAGAKARKVVALIAEKAKRLKQAEQELKLLQNSAPRTAPLAMAVEDHMETGDYFICVRGNVHKLGAKVPRGFLYALWNGEPPKIAKGDSGRRELADWLVSDRNPLTPRVYVNRVWHHLFGAGLVRTVDNFGKMGERPSHPLLLDWLAATFKDDGWSMKKLIRRIVLSRTYQQSARATTSQTPGADASGSPFVDPENRWLSHQNRRRLDAECIRDAILSVSGQLDLKFAGPTIDPKVKSEFGFKHTSTRRSVYVPAFRNTVHPLLAVFDAANPNLVTGRRNVSTLPTQALYLMNSPFVMSQSRLAAARLLKEKADDDTMRLNRAYLRTLGRPPTKKETEISLRFLQQSKRRSKQQAWTTLFQALFGSIDFRYTK